MMEGQEPPCASPSPYKLASTSSLFRDISNFKTPKRPYKNPNFQSPRPEFFTASKHTPRSSLNSRRRPSMAPSSSARSKASNRLKAFELEQSQSSRRAQMKKEQSLKSLAKSLTVWLNFMFENPGSCGCSLSIGGGNGNCIDVQTNGKRDGCPGIGVRVDAAWRSPKRHRDLSWQDVDTEMESTVGFSNSMYSSLRSSLNEVCSLDDLKQRMQVYLSMGSCKEVFDIMTHVAKVWSNNSPA